MKNNNGQLQVFQNEAFGQVRVIMKDNEPWFVGKDVAEALGYSKPSNAVLTLVKDNHKTTSLIQGTGSNYKSKIVLIDEAGFYSLVLRSKLPSAEAFQEWVTSEVLPTIRKHKMYLTPETAQEATDDPSLFLAKAMRVAGEVIENQKAKLHEQAAQIEALKPKASHYDKYMNTEDSYTITDVALMNGIRPTDLFGFLKAINWLTKQAQCAYKVTKQAPKEYFKVVKCYYGGCTRGTQIRFTPAGFKVISSLVKTANL